MRRLVLLVVGAWVLLAGGVPAPAVADDGPWGWPLDGPREVARPFAPPETRYGTGHRGADLTSVPGAAVRAAGAGRVSYAGLLAGRGVVVVVHGALRTTYEPVTAAVGVGQVVDVGEVVARLEPGHAGCPVPACLHWGLRRGEDYLDPVRLVQRGPVRLLPLGPAGGRGAALAPLLGSAGPTAGPAAAEVPDADVRLSPARLDPQPVSSERSLPLGIVAVAALVAGIGLLRLPAGRRPPLPRPPPPGPPPRQPPLAGSRPARAAAADGAAPVRAVSPDEPVPAPSWDGHPVASADDRVAEVLELEAERQRRRAG